MAVWSEVLPLTACCLSPLPWFASQRGGGGGSEKVASDLGLGGSFRRVSFLIVPSKLKYLRNGELNT